MGAVMGNRVWTVTITDPNGKTHDFSVEFHPDCDPIDDYLDVVDGAELLALRATEFPLDVGQRNERQQRRIARRYEAA